MTTQPTRVLFLCTHNSARSQIAEALLERKGDDRFATGSAGTHPAPSVHPGALAVFAEMGIDWHGHVPKGMDEVLAVEWDIVITLCDRANESCPALPSRPVTAHWGVPDPASAASDRQGSAFALAASLISRRLDLMLALRPELLDRLVLEERLRAIGSDSAAPDHRETREREPSGSEIRAEGSHPR